MVLKFAETHERGMLRMTDTNYRYLFVASRPAATIVVSRESIARIAQIIGQLQIQTKELVDDRPPLDKIHKLLSEDKISRWWLQLPYQVQKKLSEKGLI